jgi:hypothetical protein
MRRPILGWGVAIVVLVAACGEAAEPATTITSTTVTTTTSTTVTTIGTTTTTTPTPAEVDTVAMFPDEATLQDGTWAAIVFRQAIECIPEETDLVAGEPVACETPVLFEGQSPGALIGTEVPVWLIRWPVISYAESNGMTALGQIRQLPTRIETTAETYLEDDGAISLSGSTPDMGTYEIETSDGETRFAVPFEAGPEVPLAELIGAWETGGHLLRVEEGGSYELFETLDGGGEEATGVFGFVALQDGLLVFVTSAEPGPCSGDTGVYLAERIGAGLRVAAVDEPCEFRAGAFGGDWSLSSAG